MTDRRRILELLERVQSGQLDIQTAARNLESAPLADLGFAKVDLQRQSRCGLPEVIYGPGKTPEAVVAIMRALVENEQSCFATRVSPEQAELILRHFPAARHDPVSRTVRLECEQPRPKLGRVVVVAAGTSDLPVAEEARATAEAWGCDVGLIVDVGVAGIHRLLDRLEEFAGADAIVVVAGMEGALPSAVGGLVDCPVLAVPTSVGYGASFSGLAALLGMLSSCASNVAVVNIDSGFKGGYVAGLIARRAGQARAAAPTPANLPSRG